MSYEQSVENALRAEYGAYAPFRVSLREGRRGRWRIEKFRSALNDNYIRFVRNGRAPGLGEFTGLIHDSARDVVMSDTIPEILDVRPYLPFLRGDVLVTGLGIGLVPGILTKHPAFSRDVRSVTIIEKEPDVVRLVSPQYGDKRIRVIVADAFHWKPDMSFDAAWHDVWDRIRITNRAEFSAIRSHYRKAVPVERQFCWSESSITRKWRNLVKRVPV